MNIKRAYNQKKYTDLQEDFGIMMKKNLSYQMAKLFLEELMVVANQ